MFRPDLGIPYDSIRSQLAQPDGSEMAIVIKLKSRKEGKMRAAEAALVVGLTIGCATLYLTNQLSPRPSHSPASSLR